MNKKLKQPLNIAKKYFDEIVNDTLFLSFCQRRYLMPEGYTGWPSIVVQSVLSASLVNLNIYQLDYVQQLSIILTYRFAINLTYPVYVIHPKLLELIQNTELPDEIYLQQIIPCALLVFPRNAIKDRFNGSVDYLYVVQGELLPQNDRLAHIKPFKDLNIKDYQRDEKDNIYITFVYQGKNAVYVNRRKIVDNILKISDSRKIETSLKFDEEDENFNTYLLKIIVQIFLVISNLPELVQPAVCISEPKPFGLTQQTRKNYTAIWRPAYLNPPQIYQQINLSKDGSKHPHRSPRPHWRRGHWRRVRFGSRNHPQHRWHWFKPTIVNPHKL